ncbi:hypothetical protein [Jiella sp. M17.18]|uniref:hypothetical protein n=1 Tax=Jiella sp. M17.18 TaxID=3234247 RepID=UPI0034DE0BA7
MALPAFKIEPEKPPANDNRSARFASFASGFQSGSPVVGGLQGALAGLATGDPISAVVGCPAGKIGRINFEKRNGDERAQSDHRA